MAVKNIHCNTCKAAILEPQFEDGSAISIRGKNYCAHCKGTALKNIPLKGGGEVATTRPVPRQGRPVSEKAGGSAPSRRPPGVRRHRPNLLLAMSAAAGAVLVVVALARVATRGRNGGEGPPTPLNPAPIPGGTPDAVFPKPPANSEDEALAEIELRRLVGEIETIVARDKAYAEYETVSEKVDAARGMAARVAPAAAPEIQRIVAAYTDGYERLAEPHSAAISEMANGLAAERRYDDALKAIETFPQVLRRSRSWKNLENLKGQIENRKRSAPPRN